MRSGTGSIPRRFRISAIVLRANSWPRLASAPWMRRYPQSRFSSAMRTTKLSTSSLVDGRPTPRLPLPSYFSEISFRCQAKRVRRRIWRIHAVPISGPYGNAIVGNGGTESQCGWCKDRWGRGAARLNQRTWLYHALYVEVAVRRELTATDIGEYHGRSGSAASAPCKKENREGKQPEGLDYEHAAGPHARACLRHPAMVQMSHH